MLKADSEMLLLALLDGPPRHGYELAKLIESRSVNKLQIQAASLYPMLYRLERKGFIEGRWVEKPNERRRRFYKLTAAGRKMLAARRTAWNEFVNTINLVTGFDNA
jgi:PadR family transcriptional regulator PadR